MAKAGTEGSEDTDRDRPSKSHLKREALDMQHLGSELLRLTEDQLIRLNLPVELLEAVRTGRALKPDGSLKRQRKYIGRLLRQVDAELIRDQIQSLTRASAAETRALHRVEAWRDRLLAEGDAAINALMAECPEADRPKVRGLVEAALTERQREQSPRAARLLFRYLRELLTTT